VPSSAAGGKRESVCKANILGGTFGYNDVQHKYAQGAATGMLTAADNNVSAAVVASSKRRNTWTQVLLSGSCASSWKYSPNV
jgi:hypothetical protein